MNISLNKWKGKYAENIVRQIGINRGQKILDFGCGSGNYTIPIAKVVGERGIVYTLDENEEDLNQLINEAKLKCLKNIIKLKASGKSRIPLETESVDIVLLYDILHYYYFPEEIDRRQLLSEIYRVLKPNGLLSLYPTHLEANNMPNLNDVRSEIEDSNFIKESEHFGLIMAHEDNTEKGRIINYRKLGTVVRV